MIDITSLIFSYLTQKERQEVSTLCKNFKLLFISLQLRQMSSSLHLSHTPWPPYINMQYKAATSHSFTISKSLKYSPYLLVHKLVFKISENYFSRAQVNVTSYFV